VRRLKNKYEKPRKRWERERLIEEAKLVGEYGLRNKRELWRAQYIVKKYRRLAKKLLPLPPEEREKIAAPAIKRLVKYGIVPENATVDDLLDLKVTDILERRLQTIVYRKNLAKTIYHARQLVTHGHIYVNGRRVKVPSYLVPLDEEDKIECKLKTGEEG